MAGAKVGARWLRRGMAAPSQLSELGWRGANTCSSASLTLAFQALRASLAPAIACLRMWRLRGARAELPPAATAPPAWSSSSES